jgi:integrase
MQVMHARCAGLDVHKHTVVACVRVTTAGRAQKPFSVNNARVRWLPPHELARLLAAAARDVAAAWLVPAITIAVHTGLRQGELLRLRWTDLGPGRTIATIRGTKNNEPKHVPLNAVVQATLAALPSWVPPHSRGRGVTR